MNPYRTLMLLSLLAGCKSSGPSSTTTVTPEAGGMVMSEDKRVTLMVPPGAIGTATMISIKPLPIDKVPASAFPPGVGYDLQPDGTHFAMPVKLAFTFTKEELTAATPKPDGATPGGILILGLSSKSSDGTIEELDNVVFDTTTGSPSLSGELAHFTRVIAEGIDVSVKVEPAYDNGTPYKGWVGVTGHGKWSIEDLRGRDKSLDLPKENWWRTAVPIEITELHPWSNAALDVFTAKEGFPLQFIDTCSGWKIPCISRDLDLTCMMSTNGKLEDWGVDAIIRKKTTNGDKKTIRTRVDSKFLCSAAAPVDMAMAPCLGAPPKITHEITPKKVGFGGSFWVGFDGSGFGTPQVFLGSKLVACEIDFMDNKSTELKCTVDKSHTTGVVTGQACGMTIASNQTITVLPRDNPKITKMSMTAPPEGDVTIEGTNFLSNATVLFLYNDTPAASYSMRSDMKIIAKLPPGVVGMVGVQVLSSDGATAWSDTLVDIK